MVLLYELLYMFNSFLAKKPPLFPYPFCPIRSEAGQGAERLILCGCGYFPFGGEIGKKFLNFIFSHISGMGLVVKEDITPNPIYVRLFRSIGIMLEAYSVANLVENFYWFIVP